VFRGPVNTTGIRGDNDKTSGAFDRMNHLAEEINMPDQASTDDKPVFSPPNFDLAAGEKTPLPVESEGSFELARYQRITTGLPLEELGEPGAEETSGGEHLPEPVAQGDEPVVRLKEEDFSAMRWQRENTLLTNADNYAASIREEAELYVQQLREEAEELNARAEEHYHQAKTNLDEAEKEVARMLDEARAGVDEIHQQARAEGFEKGHLEGLEQAGVDAQPSMDRLEAILENLESYKDRVDYYSEKDGIRLALIMARKILKAEVTLNKKVVLKVLASGLKNMEGKGLFNVLLNPEDLRFAVKARPTLERFLKDGQSMMMLGRDDIPPGSVQIESDREVIDMTLDGQMYHLEAKVRQTMAERETIVTRLKEQRRELARAEKETQARIREEAKSRPSAGALEPGMSAQGRPAVDQPAFEQSGYEEPGYDESGYDEPGGPAANARSGDEEHTDEGGDQPLAPGVSIEIE